MVTIEINENTNAGKALLAAAKVLAEKSKGIVFLDEEADTVSFDVFAAELKGEVSKRIEAKKMAK